LTSLVIGATRERADKKREFMKTLSVMLILFGMCLFCAEAHAADWVYYGTDTLKNYRFYDRASISYPSNNIISVWKKDVYSEDGIKDYVAQRVKHKLSTYGYENLSHITCQEEFNCKTKEHSILACSIYEKSGSAIESQSVAKGQQTWEPIQPGSDVDVYHKVLCKLPPKKAKKKK
jgi:hypothetical protein